LKFSAHCVFGECSLVLGAHLGIDRIRDAPDHGSPVHDLAIYCGFKSHARFTESPCPLCHLNRVTSAKPGSVEHDHAIYFTAIGSVE
jgi:hypothetical protein